MKLTEDKVKIVIDKLNQDSKGGITCSVCGNRQWVVNKEIMELRGFNNGDIVLGQGTPIMPMVTLSCAQCGHTLFFNALQLGVVEKDI